MFIAAEMSNSSNLKQLKMLINRQIAKMYCRDINGTPISNKQ